MQTSLQNHLANQAECFSKLLKLNFMNALGEDISSFLFYLGRHHLNLSLEYLFSYIVIVDNDTTTVQRILARLSWYKPTS